MRIAAVAAGVFISAAGLVVAPAAAPALATEGTDWLPMTGEVVVGCTWDPSCGGYHASTAKAIDFLMPVNSPVYASGAGTVTQAQGGCGANSSGCNGGRGNFITISHGNYSSRYLHLSRLIVTSGSVNAGQLIAYSGNSGQNAADHLHYDELTDPSAGQGKLDPGPLFACHGSTRVTYPQAAGYSTWSQVPYKTPLRNDGYECAGGGSGPAAPPASVAASNNSGQMAVQFSNFPTGTTYFFCHTGASSEYPSGGSVPNRGEITVSSPNQIFTSGLCSGTGNFWVGIQASNGQDYYSNQVTLGDPPPSVAASNNSGQMAVQFSNFPTGTTYFFCHTGASSEYPSGGSVPNRGEITVSSPNQIFTSGLCSGTGNFWVGIQASNGQDYYSNQVTLGSFEAAPDPTGSPTPTPTTSPTTSPSGEPAPAPAALVERLAGTERLGTAITISKDSWAAAEAQSVVLARSDAFPDALAGTPLAVRRSAPLLLTPPGALSSSVANEIKRVLPASRNVYLLGGTAALAPSVADAVTRLGYRVVRLAGTDRYSTAVMISKQLGTPSTIFLATGLSFQNALISGVAAASNNGVVVLTADTKLPTSTRAYLDSLAGVERVAVGAQAATADPAATRIAGSNGYDTSRLLAERYFPAPTAAAVASGTVFADALAGGAHIGRLGGPLLLSEPTRLPAPVASYLSSNQESIDAASLYGGTAALSTGVEGSVRNNLRQ